MSIVIQLRTTKVNQLIISGTRIFDENLTTDLKPDRQKKLKNGIFILFPRVFGRAKNLSEIFTKLAPTLGLRQPGNRHCRVVHHDCLIDRPVGSA